MIVRLILCAITLSLCVITAEPSWAQNAQCSRNDIREIKRFDRQAQNKRKIIGELREELFQGGVTNQKDLDNLADIRDEIKKHEKFFSSPKYESKRPIYERCNEDMPVLYRENTPFWIPDRS